MVTAVSMHRANHAEIVDPLGNLRKDLADFNAGLAVLLELPRAPHQRAARTVRADLRARHGLAVVLRESGFGVESIDLRHAAVHEEKYHMLGFRREMRHP